LKNGTFRILPHWQRRFDPFRKNDDCKPMSCKRSSMVLDD